LLKCLMTNITRCGRTTSGFTRTIVCKEFSKHWNTNIQINLSDTNLRRTSVHFIHKKKRGGGEILTGDALYSSKKTFFILSSKSLMNSFGSSFKYFNNFSHKFGDSATDRRNSRVLGVQIMAINKNTHYIYLKLYRRLTKHVTHISNFLK
jgi:hypothetical protein